MSGSHLLPLWSSSIAAGLLERRASLEWKLSCLNLTNQSRSALQAITFSPYTELIRFLTLTKDEKEVSKIIKQVVLFGDGAGANILARFVIMYDNLVLGAILINCTGASASFTESLKDKLINWKLNISGMNPATESFLILHRFGPTLNTNDEFELRNAVENFRQNLRHSINPKNLNKFITSYMQRKNLADSLSELKCPVLMIVGSLCSQRKACRQLFEDLTKAHKDTRNSATREFFLVDGVANVIAERPDKVIASMQFFLQGLGLLSNLKIQKTPLQLNRRMSMEDYDRPLGKMHYVSRLSNRLTEEPDI